MRPCGRWRRFTSAPSVTTGSTGRCSRGCSRRSPPLAWPGVSRSGWQDRVARPFRTPQPPSRSERLIGTAVAPVTVGLVVVTYNSTAEIERCLQAIRGQTRKPNRIVIADSGSSDGTLRLVETTCARIGLAVELMPFAENAGFAVANNRAVAALDDCSLVALLNPDAFPEAGWLAALVD